MLYIFYFFVCAAYGRNNEQNNNNVHVTDNTANMKASFRCHTWIGCSCHNINLVLSHAFQSRKGSSVSTSLEEEEGLPLEAQTLIDTCKELVTLTKRTKLNNKLQTTLKQCIVTRWNNTLTTLKSISVNLGDLHTHSAECALETFVTMRYINLHLPLPLPLPMQCQQEPTKTTRRH